MLQHVISFLSLFIAEIFHHKDIVHCVYPSVDGHLDCFCWGAIINNTPMNISV